MRSIVLAAAAAVVLAACSSAPAAVPAQTPEASDPLASLRAAASAQAALPKCATLFVAGRKVAAGAQLSCLDPDGGVQYIALSRCGNGTHLGTVEPRTGAPRGFFVAPGPFVLVKGDFGTDPGYGKAYRACNA